MRDLLKNPMLYYILAPVLVGLWPLLVWGAYLPKMQRGLDSDIAQYTNAKKCMVDIITLDPGRLEVSAVNPGPGIFAYGEAVSRVADRCRITSHNYTIHAGDKAKISGKETQEAQVVLSDVDIVQACSFLYTIQHMWVNLECLKAELKKKEGAPDRWDMNLNFKYTY
jgi:hypothetical protein